MHLSGPLCDYPTWWADFTGISLLLTPTSLSRFLPTLQLVGPAYPSSRPPVLQALSTYVQRQNKVSTSAWSTPRQDLFSTPGIAILLGSLHLCSPASWKRPSPTVSNKSSLQPHLLSALPCSPMPIHHLSHSRHGQSLHKDGLQIHLVAKVPLGSIFHLLINP